MTIVESFVAALLAVFVHGMWEDEKKRLRAKRRLDAFDIAKKRADKTRGPYDACGKQHDATFLRAKFDPDGAMATLSDLGQPWTCEWERYAWKPTVVIIVLSIALQYYWCDIWCWLLAGNGA